MSSMIELPSGKIIQTDDIIYISEVKTREGLFDDDYCFKVAWASRVSEIFTYDILRDCNYDWEVLKKAILNRESDKSGMICS